MRYRSTGDFDRLALGALADDAGEASLCEDEEAWMYSVDKSFAVYGHEISKDKSWSSAIHDNAFIHLLGFDIDEQGAHVDTGQLLVGFLIDEHSRPVFDKAGIKVRDTFQLLRARGSQNVCTERNGVFREYLGRVINALEAKTSAEFTSTLSVGAGHR
eukprot:366082-Pyramimonas_sp.AAC.1